MKSGIDARFIDGQRGKLFVLLRKPTDRAGGRCVMIVPPFAEEMNKTRKMLTGVAQGLATRGVAALLPDLHATGDSEGEFREADWEVWKDDLGRAAAWAAQQGWPVAGLLCVRLGCILGVQAALAFPAPPERIVFWQPVLDGERFMTQFLRLRVAASMMEDRKETVAHLRSLLETGETLEVSGYELNRRLVGQIDAARLAESLHEGLGDLHWVEVVRDPESPLPAPTAKALEAIRQSGRPVEFTTVAGEPFWSSTEIVRIPELVARTIEVLAAAA